MDMENDEIGKEKAPETSQAVQSKEVTRATGEPKGSPPALILSHEYHEDNFFYYVGSCCRHVAQSFIYRLEQLGKRSGMRWCNQRMGSLFWPGEGFSW